MAHGESDIDYDPILLMATKNSGLGSTDGWYLDTGCSSHMTSHNAWLVSFDDSNKSKIMFADSRTIPDKV